MSEKPTINVSHSTENLQRIYQERFQTFKAAFEKDDGLWRSLSIARLAAFIAGGGISYFALQANFLLGIGVAAMFVVLFLFLVKRHAQVEARRSRNRKLMQVNEKELRALDRDFSAFGDGEAHLDPKHAFSYDLDLFGPRSIFQFINRSASSLGESRLAHWFKNPFQEREEIHRRQQSIQDMKARLDFRQHFQAIGEEDLEGETDTEKIDTWLKEEAFYLKHPYYPILRYLLPLILLGLIIAFIYIPQVTWHIPVLMMAFNLLVVRQNLDRTSRTHALLSRQYATLERYASLLNLVEKEDFQAPHLQGIRAQLKAEELKASESIKSLAAISKAFDQRLNVFAAFVLNATILWDLICIFRLEKWKEQAKHALPSWFEVLAEIDALISLGSFAYNHPDFCQPEIVEGEQIMEGVQMGHILLNPEVRIDNDLKLKGDGQYVIITGANMAGKSTFLRTIGTNLVLAMLGAPVCAQSLRFSPMLLHTSVRATDSLQDHESYFYAELVRLKAIVDRLKAGERLFIILDEMLRGTNSRDKQAGSRGFIEQLVQLKGMGMIATHDLSLGTLTEAYPDHIRNRRFEVDIYEDRLDFDYKLKEGISQNLNATFLMKKMGIVEESVGE